ncbi:MAG TPA: DUF2062 domain-containing protein [Chthoniobacteraceae bacterium]|nr:DUF2062 domain-containing protein [Chthoniobacteraceae bacterium]
MSEFFREHLHSWKGRLTQIRDTPHAIAGGVAIGFIFGFTPLFGFKTLIAVLLAWLFRCSKLSAALAVTFHDILLPIWPVILRWQFQIGFYIISHPHRLPPRFNPKHFHYENFLSFKTLHVLWPTFVGSMVLALPGSFIVYFLVLEIVTHGQAAIAGKHPPRLEGPPAQGPGAGSG